MEYDEALRQSISYIEAHIKEDLSAKEISDHVGYSLYHFSRIFSKAKGESLMDYVRKKRLIAAREELFRNKKQIIDIAFDYCFKTPGGFSKAFYKQFGYSPSTYLARMSRINGIKHNNRIGENIMEPLIIKKPAFKVAGYGIKSNIAGSYTKDVAAYWDTYSGENLESKMYELLEPPKHGEVGLCLPSSKDGSLVYLFGVIVDDFSKVTPDMLTAEVPEATYAIFTTPPVDQTQAQSYQDDPINIAVRSTWKYIFEKWFDQSKYIYDNDKIDFEFYDERCHNRADATMDIYIPIKEKIL